MKYLLSSLYLAGSPPEKWNAFINYFNHQADIYADEIYIRYYTEENGYPEYASLTYYQINCIATNLACEWHSLTKDKNVVALLVDHSSDLLISMLAVFKLRIPVLLLSPRNSKAAIENLLQVTKCSLLISSDKYTKKGEEAVNYINGCNLFSIPKFNIKVLSQKPLNDQAISILDNNFDDQDSNKIGLITHSSGTTGFPKPVYLTNKGVLSQFMIHQEMIECDRPIDNNRDVFLACAPMFHCFGFDTFFSILYAGGSAVFLRKLPPSQQDIEFALKSNKCTIMSISPTIMKEMVEFSKNKDISHIQSLRCIMSGGAPIPKDVGNWYCSNGIKVCICYGSSETGCTMSNNWDAAKEFTGLLYPYLLDPNRESYYCFKALNSTDPNIKYLRIRGDFPGLANVGLSDDNFYETGDLFKESPEHPGCYYYLSRKDDTIVMANGEKTNPNPMEEILNMCPVIKKSIVFGSGRQCTAVLILTDTAVTEKMSEDEVLGYIKDALKNVNEVSPSHSMIVPQMVKILPPDTELPLTPKGTIIKRKASDMFKDILDRLYDDFLEGPQNRKKGKTTISASWNKQKIVQFLLKGASKILGLSIEQIEVDKSLFDLGLDSLKSIQLRNYISAQFDVDNNFIFHHSSISSMHDGLTSKEVDSIEISYTKTQNISEKYLLMAEKEFSSATKSVDRSNSPKVVLLTGATGSLGAFILSQLLKDTSVKKVYCIIRGESNKLWSRLEKSFCDRSLDISLLSNKDRIETVSLDFMDKTFGLDKDHFLKLKQEVTIIQHCGWLLDFNMPVDHFEKECITPFYNLLKFSLKREDPIPVHFISSISASACLDPVEIKETPLPVDSKVALPMGYAQSKFIVEVILDLLATKKNLPCYIYRVGQMYGDTEHGIWNHSEQFPLMFIGGGFMMGVMPQLDMAVDWLPVDYAAATIIDIMSETYSGKAMQHIYHIVNPQLSKWTDILDILKSSGADFVTVSLSEWISTLTKSPNNPATALISHFESMQKDSGKMPIWNTKKTSFVTPIIDHIPPLDIDLFKKFLAHWKSTGFL